MSGSRGGSGGLSRGPGCGSMCRGLVAGLERKNGWTLAEQAGEASARTGCSGCCAGRTGTWTGSATTSAATSVEQLGDPGGVLIADDTGFLKKGTRSAGVQRQYSGTAGRTENCQVGVFLAYASRYGHALIDRELYLPQSWAEDPERCRAAGIPQDAEFTTKPRQAQAMIARAVAAGVPFAWFTADETYGQAKWLQAWLEEKDIWYVMAIRCSDTLTTPEGERRADALIAAVPPRSWQQISAGAGAHGPREYHWARVPVRPGWEARPRALAAGPPVPGRPAGDRLLRLLRAPPVQHRRPGLDRGQPLAHRGVHPAGQGRGRARPVPGPHLAGLVCPHHLVHARPGLARRQPGPGEKGAGTGDPGMIGYTLAEIRRLLNSLVTAHAPDPDASGPGPAGADDASTRPGSATTSGAATRSLKCRRSIKRQVGRRCRNKVQQLHWAALAPADPYRPVSCSNDRHRPPCD